MRELETKLFGEEMLLLAMNLLEGDVKSRHNPSPLLAVSHHVVLVVEELEVDHVVDLLREVMPQVIKLVKGARIVLEVMTFGLGRHKINVVPSLIVVDTRLLHAYISFTWGTTSGE